MPVPDIRKQRVRKRCSVLLVERMSTRRSRAIVLVPGGVNSYVPVLTATSTWRDSGVPSRLRRRSVRSRLIFNSSSVERGFDSFD